MSNKSGHSKPKDSQDHDDDNLTAPDAISDGDGKPSQAEQTDKSTAKSEVEAARNLFARASQQGLPALKKELSPEAKAAAAQYFSKQNGQKDNGGAAEVKKSKESDAMSGKAEHSLNDFTPPDDDGIAAITGSHKRITIPEPPALNTHHIEAAIRSEAAPFAQTQVDQDALPDGNNEALNAALGQALNRALNASPAKGLRKGASEPPAPLVLPNDASKRGFIDAYKSASKASRTNLQASIQPSERLRMEAESGQYVPAKAKPVAPKPQPVPSNRPSDYQDPVPAPKEQKVDIPVNGKGAEDKQTNWPQQAEFERARAIWADQVGSIKAQPARRNSQNVARNLRSIMTTGISNVREVYSLRGLACLMVFMTQAQFFTAHVQPSLPLATIAAQLFFVMSGFFVTRQIITNENAKPQLQPPQPLRQTGNEYTADVFWRSGNPPCVGTSPVSRNFFLRAIQLQTI